MTSITSKLKSLLMVGIALVAVGCSSQADVASYNLSKAAEEFQIERKVVFYDSIQGMNVLVIEGRCSLDIGSSVRVTCRTGPNEYKKHYLGLADNVTYFAEQLDAAATNTYHYKVYFRPEVLIPDIDLKTSVTGG